MFDQEGKVHVLIHIFQGVVADVNAYVSVAVMARDSAFIDPILADMEAELGLDLGKGESTVNRLYELVNNSRDIVTADTELHWYTTELKGMEPDDDDDDGITDLHFIAV